MNVFISRPGHRDDRPAEPAGSKAGSAWLRLQPDALMPPVPWATLLLLSAGCSAAVLLRPMLFELSPDRVLSSYFFLGWNLFLGWLPLLFISLGARFRIWWATIPVAVLYMLFLPNAFYLFTDFVHLRSQAHAVGRFDLLVLFAFSCTGAALGLYAMRIAQFQWALWASGRAVRSMLFVSSLASGLGVWLGRIFRWNSWDALLHPGAIVRDLFFDAQRAEMWMLGLGTGLLIYALYRLMFHPFH